MKELTKIEPQPPVDDISSNIFVKRLLDIGHILGRVESTDLIRLLIQKVNDLTEEVNRMKNDSK